MNEQLLKDYVATANSGKYSSFDEVNAKFPEFNDVDPQILKDYVATVNSGKYSNYDQINQKFPEFSSVGVYGALDLPKVKIPEIQVAVVQESNKYEDKIKDVNIKNMFDIKKSIKKDSEKVTKRAAENYFNLDKLERPLKPYDGESDFREFVNEDIEVDIRNFFDDKKYEEYKAYQKDGTLPTESEDFDKLLKESHTLEIQKALQQYVSEMDKEEKEEAVFNFPSYVDGEDDINNKAMIEAFEQSFDKDSELYRIAKEKLTSGSSIKDTQRFLIKTNPEKALKWQANYLANFNEDFTKTYDKFKNERKTFLDNNKDVFDEYNALEQERKDMGNITERSDLLLIEKYNSIVDRQMNLQNTMKERGIFKMQDTLIAKETEIKEKLDDLLDKAEMYENQAMATDALVKDYSFLGNMSLMMEDFFIANTNMIAQGAITKIGQIGRDPDNPEDKKIIDHLNKQYRAAIDYKEKLGLEIQDLPLTIKAEDINKDNIWRATKQMLANNSPSILVALGSFGYGSIASRGLTGAAKAQVLRQGSKAAMAAFFVGEGGAKLGDMEIMQRYAGENIKRLNEELEGDVTPDKRIQLETELEQQERALNYSQFERAFSAFAYGGAAAYAEKLGTLGYLNRLQMATPAIGKSFLQRTLRSTGQALFVMPSIELIEETATQLTHNFIDIQLGEDRSFVDGIDKDFVLNTVFTSLAIQGPSRSINMYNGIKSAVSNIKERSKSLELTQELIDTQTALNEDKLTAVERKALVQNKRVLIEQLAMQDQLTVQKVARMSNEDIRALFDVDRQQRNTLRDLRGLGAQRDSQKDKKQKQELIDKYNSLDAQKEFLLGKPQKQNEKLLKKFLKRAGLELGVDINPNDVTEINYQIGKYQANKDMTDGIDGTQTRVFEGDNVQQDFFDYLDSRVQDNSLSKEEADRLKAKEKLPYAAVVGGQQVLFENEIYKGILQGGPSAKVAASAPLHELTHKWLRTQGIVTKDGDIAEWSLKSIQAIEGRLNEMIENNLIDNKSDIALIRTRIKQYKEGDKVNLEEMVTLLGDLKDQGIIGREQKSIINNLKIFFNKLAGKVLGDQNIFMRFDNFEDISGYLDSFQESVKESTLVLPPDEEVQPGSQLSEAYAGLDADLLIEITKTSKLQGQIAAANAEITKQFDNLALNALGYDPKVGDINRANVVAAAREFLPGIIQRYNKKDGAFSTFVDSNIRPKRPQIYEAAKTLQDREAKKLDAPEVGELAGDVNVSTNTAADEFIKKIDVLGFNGLQNVLDDIAKLVKVKPGDTFKQIIQRYADKVGELIFKVPPIKINDGTKNLTYAKKFIDGIPEQSEAGNIQKFFNAGTNAERFIKILPPTNVTSETADINKIPENIDVSRNVLGLAIGLKGRPLNYFYNKTNKRSKGLTSQTPVWELKDEFKNPTPETVEQFKKDLGITPRNELNNYDRRIGQLLKGIAKVYSINAALSAAQRFQEARTEAAPKEQRPAIRQQTADITAAQSKTAFSETINAVEDLISINDIFQLETKGIDGVLGFFGADKTFNIKTDAGRKKFLKAIEEVLLPLMPKQFWINESGIDVFTGSNANYKLSMSTNDDGTFKKPEEAKAYTKFRNDVRKLIKNHKNFGKDIPNANFNVDKIYTTIFGNKNTYTQKLKNKTKIKQWNKDISLIHKAMWQRFNNAIANDKTGKVAGVIGTYLKLTANDKKSWHRLGAQIAGYSLNITKRKNGKAANIEFEHAMPATAAYLYLMDASLRKGVDFNTSYDLVIDNYKLIVLDKAMDDKLTNSKTESGYSLQKRMPDNWSLINNKWWERYFNNIVNSVDGGIDPNSIVDLDGKTFAEKFNISNVGAVIQQNKLQENKIDQSLIVSSKTVESKGISILDFDDTLATTQSLVRFTAPDGTTGTLNAEQYASTYQDLQEQGYTFDFSEFNKVVGGKIAPLFQKALKLAKKFGTKNMFVLTARPAAAAQAIYEFLKANGLNIPLKNITGLGNSTSEAKALWVADKVGLGYNDFYFADDALQNVQAVKNILDQFDVKSKVRQAKTQFSESLSVDLNKIIEENEGVAAEKVFSKAEASLRGAKKGRFKLYIPPGAEDFMGLMYTLANAKGKKGEAQIKFFEDNILKPYQAGVRKINSAKQLIQDAYKQLLNEFPELKKGLRELVPGMNFTVDAAIRVYLWDKAGFDIPDISKTARQRLVKHVESNRRLVAFADGLSLISRRKEGYVQPETDWVAGTILSDIDVATNVVGRKEFLNEFIENVDATFTKENLNKIEAIYGLDFVEALNDIIFRMKSGKNRNVGSTDRQVQRWTNWIQNSVGAIMFLNMRSALLQTISAINFINWSDNNPAKAAMALANVKQFAKDFAMIFNSDFLKQRRTGLRTDVNEAALANAMAGKKDKARAILAYLLKKGFTPTQIADSFAIASGGATFYRNRVNTYIKQGLSQKEAETKAFADMQAISEVSQQSADPALISKQQASILGRFILAFQNTPMQYARLTKKAAIDLIKGRGDWKTNVSKIVYYAAIQNIIFSALQSALFALAFADEKDEEEEDKKIERLTNNVIDSLLRGTGIYGAVVSTAKNIMLEFWKQDNKKHRADHAYTLLAFANISPPIGSKLRKVYSATQTRKFNRRVMEEVGFSIDNPIVPALGQAIEGFTNLPLGRAIQKINNMRAATQEDVELWQRMALIMGWNTWDIGVENDRIEKIKRQIKQNRKNKRSNKSSFGSKGFSSNF